MALGISPTRQHGVDGAIDSKCHLPYDAYHPREGGRRRVDLLKTSQLLTDEYSVKILVATIRIPKSAQEISDLYGIPIAACYRRIRDLEEEGLTLAAALPFSDHCSYGEREIAEIVGAAASCGADYLITTEKDGVKLGQYRERLPKAYTAPLEMWVADPGPLVALLEKFL